MSVLSGWAKVAAGAVDRVSPPGDGVVVLIYHRVGGHTGVAVDQPADLFEEQMAWLAASGRVVSLDEAVESLLAATAPERGSIVVTFDDGTADFATNAVPVLERHGLPATLYVATDFIERQIDFPDNGRPLTWSALRDCTASRLVTVGSHTHTHALLDRMPEAQAADELDRSVALIGDRLGLGVDHFAYPKALPGSPAADRLVRARFKSAAVARTRPNLFGRADPYALCRSPIQVSDGMKWFERKAAGGMWVEDSLRRLVNRRRYAGATT